MFSRWFLVFGLSIVLFSMHAYCKIEWQENPTPDFSEFDKKVAENNKEFDKNRDEMLNKHDSNVKKAEKAALTILILCIVLPIVACLIILICCGVGIGITVWCVCKKQKK